MRYTDGSVPSYSDSLGGKGDVWAVTWSSLDATAWLYYVAARKSPFKKYVEFTSPLNLEIPQKMEDAFVVYPNPGSGEIVIQRAGSRLLGVDGVRIYSVSGVCLFNWHVGDNREIMHVSVDINNDNGVVVLNEGKDVIELEINRLNPGVYCIEIKDAEGVVQRLKWVKE